MVSSLFSLLSGDVELNPGAKCNIFFFFFLSLESKHYICLHNYAKVFLLKAYIDIICISETYLYSSAPSNDNNLENFYPQIIQTTLLITKEVVFVFITKVFILKIFNVQYSQKSICFKLKIDDKTCDFLSLRRTPNQSQNKYSLKILN